MIQKLNKNLELSLKKYFGFEHFRGLQKEVITSLLEGNDVFVLMPTGGGKSLCYQLPALVSEGTLIVVSPLIALMKNQVDVIRGISKNDGIAHVFNSSLNKSEANVVIADLKSGLTKILFVAPETLNKEENIELLKEISISFYAIDEAHCISEWGHDFRPEYKNLRRIIDAIGSRPVIALTATATPKIQIEIQKNLSLNNPVVFKASFNRPNLFYEVRPKVNADKQLIKFIREQAGKSGIIYCNSRKKVEEISQFLQVNGIKAMAYHAGLNAKIRTSCQDDFLMHKIDVIVATVAFGMGIDKPDIRFVIHYEMPKSLENYYQETGRAGRDGGEGFCLAFYDYKDLERLEKLLGSKPNNEKAVGINLIHEMIGYAETAMNRRKYLLNYFGEDFDEENGDGAKMDDNSVNPKKVIDASKNAILVLNTVLTNNKNFKLKELTNYICKDFSEKLENVDTGDEKRYLTTLIRQLIIYGYLYKEIISHGEIKITDKGIDFIKNKEHFNIVLDHNYEEAYEDKKNESQSKPKAIDIILLKQLEKLRKELSVELKIPTFAIFQDQSLEDMCYVYPINFTELSQVYGVGLEKAKKFGGSFIKLISEYVKVNKIEKFTDLLVKQLVNKSSNKLYIIQSIDRKIDLEDIAANKNWTISELISEMESIVYQGTKLNIDYYLDQILEEDQQKEIFDFLMEADNDSILNLRKEFSENSYSKEELRLVRIKFLNTVAF
ncbi:MAG: RecQ family ATP-dependent DNA helicase [Solirubrobacteraceae bacterium]